MAAQVGALYVQLTMDSRPYTAGMSRVEASTRTAVRSIERDVGVAQKSILGLTNSAGSKGYQPHALMAVSRGFENAADRSALLRSSLLSLTAVAGGLTAALGSNLIARYADTYINLSNQVKTVTDSTENFGAVQKALSGVAGRSRSDLQATTTLYARTARATETLGLSQEKLLRITETVQKAFSIGGATSAEASGAAIQLSQGIASDRFSGEEYRSVAENAPVLLRGMAESLGVSIGKLREMAHAGELTADVVTKALLKASDRIEKEFSTTAVTIDRALGQVDNSLITYIGSADKAYGVSTLLAQGLIFFGKNLDSVIPTLGLAAAAIGTFLIARNKMLVGGASGALAGGAAGFGLAGLPGALIGAGIGGLGGSQGASKGPSIYQKIKTEAADARDRVVELSREQKRLEEESLAARKNAYEAKAQSRTDPLASASKSYQSAFERDALAIQKLDEAKLANQEALRDSYAKLAQVSTEMTPKAIKLADDQIAAEQKLKQTLDERRTVQGKLTQATTRETAALGMQATFAGKLSTLTAATSARAVVVKQLGETEKQIAVDRIAIANRESKIVTEASARDKRMIKERIDIQRQMNAQLEEQNKIEAARTTAVGSARGSRKEGEADGYKKIATEISNTAVQARVANDALKQNSVQLSAATRAASGFSVATRLAGAGIASIWGALGGGAGVALMIGVGALGLLAAGAAEAKAQTERLKGEMRDLGLLAKDASTGIDSMTKSLADMQADEMRSKIREIGKELERIKGVQNPFQQIFSYDKESLGNLQQEINSAITNRGSVDLKGKNREAAKEVWSLVNAMEAGSIKSSEVEKRLNEIAAIDPGAKVDGWLARLRQIAPFMDALVEQTNNLQSSLASVGVNNTLEDRMVAVETGMANAATSAMALKSVMSDLTKDAAMSESDQALAKETDKVLEAWKAINTEKGVSVEVSRQEAENVASLVIATQDAAKQTAIFAENKKKEAAETQEFMQKLNDIMTDLEAKKISPVDDKAASQVEELIHRFELAEISADDLIVALTNISKQDVSDPIRTLIGNLAGAIPGLDAILNRMNAINGGGLKPTSTTGPGNRGAIGRSHRALKASQDATASFLAEQKRQSELTSEQKDLETRSNSLQSDAKANGVKLTPVQAMSTALTMQSNEQTQSAAAAARTKAEKAAAKAAGGGSAKDSSYDNALERIKKKTDLLDIESDATNTNTFAIAKAKATLDLETAAKDDSIGLSTARIAQIDAESDAYARQAVAIEANKKKQKEMADAMAFYKDTFTGFFTDVGASLRQGENIWSAFGNAALNALGKIADRMISMAADGLFDILAGVFKNVIGGAVGGGLRFDGIGAGAGAFSNIAKLATGGPVIGPGSGTSDSILANLSNGEFVVNARSARAFRPLLESINDNRPSFAAGGAVSPSMSPRASLSGLTKGMGKSSAPAVSNVYSIDARGAQRGVGEEIRDALIAYDKSLPDRVKQISNDPRKRK